MPKSTYSLSRKSERYDSPVSLFESLKGRLPNDGEFISCHCHCSIIGKSFLTTYDFGVKK